MAAVEGGSDPWLLKHACMVELGGDEVSMSLHIVPAHILAVNVGLLR